MRRQLDVLSRQAASLDGGVGPAALAKGVAALAGTASAKHARSATPTATGYTATGAANHVQHDVGPISTVVHVA